METTKKILHIAAAFGIVALSTSALVYSIKDHKAYGAPPPSNNVSGIVYRIEGNTAIYKVVSSDGTRSKCYQVDLSRPNY